MVMTNDINSLVLKCLSRIAYYYEKNIKYQIKFGLFINGLSKEKKYSLKIVEDK
jgi:hypothetical protein